MLRKSFAQQSALAGPDTALSSGWAKSGLDIKGRDGPTLLLLATRLIANCLPS